MSSSQIFGGESSLSDSIGRDFDVFLEDFGHWVIYRRYDLTRKSTYVDETTGEGVSGPRWTYVDEPIKIRHDSASVRAIAGLIEDESKIYCGAEVRPKRGDVVIEIDYDGDSNKLTPGVVMSYPHREAYRIDELDTKRGIGGHVVYYRLIVKPELKDY